MGKKKSSKKHRVYFGIKIKLIIAFMIPVILIIALGSFSYKQASEGMIESYESALKETMMTTGKYFNLGFVSVETAARQIASDEEIENIDAYTGYGKMQKVIVTSLKADKKMSNIHILAANGYGVSTKAGTIREDLFSAFSNSEEGSILNASENDAHWFGLHNFIDEKLKTNSGQYSISYILKATDAVGFSGKSGKTVAYVIVDVNTSLVMDVLNEFSWGEGSVAGFITADGREITSLEEQGEEAVFANQDFYVDAVSGAEENGASYCNYNGEEYLFVYSKVDASGSLVCGLIPKREIVKQADEIRTVTRMLVVAAALIAIFVGTVIAMDMGRALKKMRHVLTKASKGDLTVAISMRRKDEFGVLAQTISDTLSKMRTLLENASHVNEGVSASAEEVFSLGTVLLGETEEIMGSLEEIQVGITKQAEDTQDCLSSMELLSNKVNSVYDNVHEIKKIANGTKEVAGNGLVMIDNLNSTVKETVSATQNVIENIEHLDNETRAISSIVHTINEIAQQTNLLSLNASIEAARAGEAGRGFTVVATEVRKLADQSIEAADKIQDIINQVITKTEETVTTARRAENIVSNQEGVLKDTVKVFYNINEQVEGLAGTIGNISSEMKDIEKNKNITLEAMESISAIAEETAAVSEEINSSAVKQMDAVKTLNKSVEELENGAENLKEAMDVFQV